MEYRDMVALVVVLVGCYLATSVEGLVHCHCNSPACIGTSYMCLSELGQCYSLYSTNGPLTMASYGCKDTLDTNLQCSKQIRVAEAARTEEQDGGADTRAEGDSEKAVLLCCDEDMCNHLAERDVEVVKTLNFGAENQDESQEAPPYDRPQNYYSNEGDLWFKASVIGVPISGGFILLFLVLLAFRMLKNDKKRQSRMIQLRTEQSLAKAQLYVSDHFHQKKSSKDATRTSEQTSCKEYCKINAAHCENLPVGVHGALGGVHGTPGVVHGACDADKIWAPGYPHAQGSIV